MENREDNCQPRIVRWTGITATIMGTLIVPGGALATSESIPPRPYLPSGTTCAEKVGFYLKYGGIQPGKIAVSECSNKRRGQELLSSINSVEEAAKVGNKNPIGLIRIASSESRLIPTEEDYDTGAHKGLFQIGYYNVPVWSSGAKLMASRYFRAEKKRNPKASMRKPDGNLYNPRSNAFMAVWAINSYGPGPWKASAHHWGSMRNYITGNKAQYKDFLDLQKWTVGIKVNYGLDDGV